MKKLLLLCILLFALILPAAAQITGVSPPAVDLLADFTTIAGVAAFTLLIAGWIKTAFKLEGALARWVSWAVAIVISFVGWYFNIGLFDPLLWWQTIFYGFGIGLVANGIYSAETIQLILSFFGAQVKRE